MSLESWTAHQTAKGLREYGAPLSASGLSVAQLLQHAACEAADLVAYLREAAPASSDLLAAHADAHLLARHVCQLAGPAPEFVAAPQVPDADAVAKYGRYWWRGDVVVSVSIVHGVLRWTQPGYDWADYLDPTDDWGGPVVARRRSVLPVSP